MSLFRRFIRPGPTQADAPSPERITGMSVTANGYIDLGTSANYLNGLRAANMAISGWFYASGQAQGARYFSAETAVTAGVYAHPKADTEDTYCNWSGTAAASLNSNTAQGSWHNITVVYDITDDTAAFALVDGGDLATDNTVTGLAAVQASIIRLGAEADNGLNRMAGTFGPFCVMDISGTTINTAAEATALALAITNAGLSGESMRRAIVNHDAAIVGKIWKLNDLAVGETSTGSGTVNRYAIETGALEGATNSATSAATGALIG